jgi:hypothetical protein
MLQMRKFAEGKEKQATVRIQWKSDDHGGKAYPEKPFSGADWNELTKAIADAQNFLIDATGKEVAEDQVIVTIERSDCEDLTLVDLPGMIRAVGDGEDASIIEKVKALIDSHLQNERCVVLAVHQAGDDFQNSGIFHDAKRVDPNMKRTIPVLTKPDLIDKGGEAGVVDLLLGKKVTVSTMGFHMVKGRGPAMVTDGVSLKDALAQEIHFFETTSPWNTLPNKNLFGTANLARKLGELELKRIEDSTPAILESIEGRLKAVEAEMIKMGTVFESIQEKRVYFSEKSNEFCRRIESALDGTESYKPDLCSTEMTAIAKFSKKAGDFKTELLRCKLAEISTETPP